MESKVLFAIPYSSLPSGTLSSGSASFRSFHTMSFALCRCILDIPTPNPWIPQRIHIPWRATDLSNYKTLLSPPLEDPTKF